MKAEGNKEESWKEVFKYSAWDRGNWLRSCYFRELRCHEARIGKIRRWADAERNKTATMEKEKEWKRGEVDFELILSVVMWYIYWPIKYIKYSNITNNTNNSKKIFIVIIFYPKKKVKLRLTCQAFIRIRSLRKRKEESIFIDLLRSSYLHDK